MKKTIAFVLLVCAAAAVIAYQAAARAQVQNTEETKALDTSGAIALAQRLHDELNLLEIAGRIEEQMRYYSDTVVRLDQNRKPQQGKAAFLAYANEMRDAGYRVESAATTVLHAAANGDQLVEYGTTLLKGSFGGQSVTDDPVNYMALWRINPANPSDAQIEAIIWNTQQPMAGLDATTK